MTKSDREGVSERESKRETDRDTRRTDRVIEEKDKAGEIQKVREVSGTQ